MKDPTSITVDVAQIPEYRAAELAERVSDKVLAYLEQPGMRERFEQWKRERRAAMKGGDSRKE